MTNSFATVGPDLMLPELRKQENIKLRQRLIPWVEDQNVSYSEPAIVSL